MPLVQTKNLNKVYRTGGNIEVHALRDVTLEIEAGSFISIMGPSGSGKSTLLNLLGCLDRPTSGELYIEGVETSGLSSAELTRIRREKIGFVFQSFNLIPTLTALENVMLPLRYEKRPNPKAVASEALEQVGLSDRLDFRSNELSGGEQQRVAIARALVLKPSIILADEPTGELDSTNSEAIMALLKRLNSDECQTCRTFVLVTHDPGIAAQTEQTLIMKDGALDEVATLG
ncbi:MAG: ABC transporter ATP-binding protein [Actinobacteria bacterium]|nr:ABC transporter ATP-binding protein [Actinomycetota bacterium]